MEMKTRCFNGEAGKVSKSRSAALVNLLRHLQDILGERTRCHVLSKFDLQHKDRQCLCDYDSRLK